MFVGLGVARLLVVAVPAGLGRPQGFLVHAFSQLLVAVAMVCAAALWRYGARAATYLRIAAALTLAAGFVHVLGAPYTHAILQFTTRPLFDPQDALGFLPAFQSGLFLALWVAAYTQAGWRRFLYGALALATIQIAVNGGVQWLAVHAGIAPLVRDVRAWALAGPALIIAMVVNVAPAHR